MDFLARCLKGKESKEERIRQNPSKQIDQQILQDKSNWRYQRCVLFLGNSTANPIQW